MPGQAPFTQSIDAGTTDSPRAGRYLKWVPTILLAAFFVIYFVATRAVSAVPGWSSDYTAAAEEARSTGRPIVVAFHSQGCPPCAMMDRMVLGEPIIQKALSRFVPVRLDVAQHPELSDRFGVIGTPTYSLVSPSGEQVAQVSGYLPVESFLKFLNEASKRIQTDADRPNDPAVPAQQNTP